MSFQSFAEDGFGALLCKCALVVTTMCLRLLRFTGLEPGSVLCAFRDSQVPYVEERWPFYDGGGAGYEQKGQAPCLVFPEAGTSSLQLRLSL